MELQQLVKKTHTLLLDNKRKMEENYKRMHCIEYLNETHDERVLSKYENQLEEWQRVNRIIRRKKSKSTLIDSSSGKISTFTRLQKAN